MGAHVSPRIIDPQVKCTLYAAPHGASRASGRSRHSPTRIGRAIARVRAGGVVCLKPGVYRTISNLTIVHSGRRGKPITVTGDGGRAVILYTRGRRDGGVIQTTYCRPWCASHNIVIENLTLDGGGHMNAGVFAREGSRYVTVRNCIIKNAGASGISFNATDHVTAEHNLIFHNGYGQGWGSGITLWFGGWSPVYGGRRPEFDHRPGFHNYVVGNLVAGSYDGSGHHTEGNGIIVDGAPHTPPSLIANNVSYENGGAGFSVYRSRGSTWFVNNTSYANGLDSGIALRYSSNFQAIKSTGVHWVNNVAYGRRNWRYHIAWTYNTNRTNVGWVRDVAYNGDTSGIHSAMTHNSKYYRYVNPRFVAPPRIPTGSHPWAHAVAPWRLGNGLSLRPSTPIIHWGDNPLYVHGITPALRRGLRSAGFR